MKVKVVTPGKIVPVKCCLSVSNISVKNNFKKDVLINQRCHTFSEMSGVCVTYLAYVELQH